MRAGIARVNTVILKNEGLMSVFLRSQSSSLILSTVHLRSTLII